LQDNTYQIVVHTSDCKGAGTDATVFVDLQGRKGKTGPLKLDDSRDNFERGKVREPEMSLHAPSTRLVTISIPLK
jgi:hypothetical protein